MKTLTQFIAIITISILFLNCNKDSQAGGKSTGAGGSTARFTISGDYLYVVDHLRIKSFLLSGGQSPVLKSTIDVGLNIETIFPYKDKLFVGSSTTMYIYSLANPSKPSLEGKAQYQITMSCDPVVARDSVAYATLRATGPCGGGQSVLVTYDIRNTTDPVLKRATPLTGPYGLGLSGNTLYVCEGGLGLQVFNVQQAYDPEYKKTVSGEIFYDVIPYGGVLICQVDRGVSFYDIATDPLNPRFLSKIMN